MTESNTEMSMRCMVTVRTPKFTHHGWPDDKHEDWEILFDEETRNIVVCRAGCNGTYFRGQEKEDGSTTLHPALDKVFRQWRQGEYVHPAPPLANPHNLTWMDLP